MSVVGFDIGNENCVIAAAKHRGIDVLLNDESKRETPAVVSFGEKQRFLGSAGAAFAATNPRSTISQVKRLIGRRYKEPSVQGDLKLLPFEISESQDGGILIHLEYMNERHTFTPVQILGMLFVYLKQMTEKNLESPIVDCVIGIPSYFTDLQRHEYLGAASIAGLKPLRLMHDCTAIALGYGIYMTDISKSRPTNVVFVDIGHCDTQVTVAAFEHKQMKILSHAFDQHLGGRDFDELLFKYFAAQFNEKYNIDVYSDTRASIRLRASCEKLKKVLSANTEAPLSIECLIEERDVKGFITRDEFENLSSELLHSITIPCRSAMTDSGLHLSKIDSIEIVGSGSRIPAIMKKLSEFFQKEPKRTLNASECVARGCALQCAMLSPALQVKEYEVQDSSPYSIGLCSVGGKNDTPLNEKLFIRGSPFPSSKVLTVPRSTTFRLEVCYTHETYFSAGILPIGYFMIGPFEIHDRKKARVKVKFLLNIHGIVILEFALVLLYDERRKGQCYRQNLGVCTEIYGKTRRHELFQAQERERILAEQDVKVEQTKEKRNSLESFVYDTRSKLLSSYQKFATNSEKERILKSLQETEDWLYEDGDDESEQVYTSKLEDLRKLLDPIEYRIEEKAREQVLTALLTCIHEYWMAADSLPPGYKKEVKNECKKAHHLLDYFFQHEDSPSSSDIYQKMEDFERMCEHIMRSKSSSQRYDEPVNSDERGKPDRKHAD